MGFGTSRSIWLQLQEEFTERIVIGRWVPGKQIPRAWESTVELGVNPNTVQRTLTELERDGPCHSERAVGRFVTDDVEHVFRLQYDLATGTTDELITRAEGFGLPETEAVALIVERWNQQRMRSAPRATGHRSRPTA